MSGPVIADLVPQTQLYNAQVIERYQSIQRLRALMQERVGGGASAYIDWIGAKTEMSQVPFGAAELPTSAVDFTKVTTEPLRFVLKTALAESDQSLTNVDIRAAHATVHGLAAGRMVDILKLRAIFNNPTTPVGNIAMIPKVAGPNTGLNVKKIVQTDIEMNNRDVPDMDRNIVANSDQFGTLFEDTLYNDSRISNQYPLKTGMIPPYMGFDFIRLAKNASNAIAVTTVAGPPILYDSYAVCVQFDAMKMEFNVPIRTVISYDEQNLNYVIVTELVANAQIMQVDGLQLMELELDEDGQAIDNGA